MENLAPVAYLACPYSHPDPQIKAMRLQCATATAFHLIKQGIYVYSPLTHNMTTIDALGIHGHWDTWKTFDFAMISRCDKLIVLTLPGWEESRGVMDEIDFAHKIGLPVEEMDFPQECLTLISTPVFRKETVEIKA